MLKIITPCFLLFLLIACNDSSNEPPEQTDSEYIKEVLSTAQSKLDIPNNQIVEHYQILLLGNSHVQSLASMISRLIEVRFPEKQVSASSALGVYYLSERIEDRASVERLVNTPWTHVILQAQKYSASGAFTYPTDAAVSWIQLAKTQNTTPILFPEHPRFGNKTEGLQVYQIHQGIAEIEPACVGPIGLAWDRAIMLYPELSLHQSDGNHANIAGKLLTAFIFYQIITGESADALPYIAAIDVNEATQDLLGQVASFALEQTPACDY